LDVDELRGNILFTEMERENSWLGDEREKKIMEIGGKKKHGGK
jgi:hypothetical protein